MVTDALRIARRMATANEKVSSTKVPEDEIIKTIGIESTLSRERARQAMVARQNHIEKILSNQQNCTAEELRIISQETSRQATKRSHSLAVIYWKSF